MNRVPLGRRGGILMLGLLVARGWVDRVGRRRKLLLLGLGRSDGQLRVAPTGLLLQRRTSTVRPDVPLVVALAAAAGGVSLVGPVVVESLGGFLDALLQG